MGTIYASDIITKAMTLIGAIASGEIPSSSEMNDGLFMLNSMIDNWSARRFMQMETTPDSIVLTSGLSAYTFGVGGNINSTAPFSINDIYIRDGSSNDSIVERWTKEQWDGSSNKAIASGRPLFYYYNPGSTQQSSFLGTLNLYPIPDASTIYTLFINSMKLFTEFATQSDIVTFQKAYTRALIYNLAIDIAPMYERHVLPDIEKIAVDSVKYIRSLNAKVPTAAFDLPKGSIRRRYNINSDI